MSFGPNIMDRKYSRPSWVWLHLDARPNMIQLSLSSTRTSILSWVQYQQGIKLTKGLILLWKLILEQEIYLLTSFLLSCHVLHVNLFRKMSNCLCKSKQKAVCGLLHEVKHQEWYQLLGYCEGLCTFNNHALVGEGKIHKKIRGEQM